METNHELMEELEEENCNMIDGIPNNGYGKTWREDEKREQDIEIIKKSLKERLADKKEQLSGSKEKDCQEKDRNKTSHRKFIGKDKISCYFCY